MKKHIKKAIFPLLLSAALLLAGCGAVAPADDPGTEPASSSTSTSIPDVDSMFKDRDLDASYDESQAVTIRLEGGTASCDSDAVTVDGGTVTITAEGTYLLSGTLTDGRIVVRADDSEKVQLVLKDADITCSDSAAIYAVEADKVFITLADGTENRLANGGSYADTAESNIDAVIFAKTDLTLNGSGSLTVLAAAGHGVVCKDDLVVTGGSYTIDAAEHGMEGKDSVRIADGTLVITAGKDGIHAENSDDAGKGWLYVRGGSFDIAAQGDAVSAGSDLRIDGGSFSLTTGAGSASVTLASDADGFGGAPWGGNSWNEVNGTDDGLNCIGLKADGSIALYGGSFDIDAVDDAIHAGGAVEITDGDFSLRSGDDAIHSDSDVLIRGGAFDIPYCYEGVESSSVTIDGGTLNIVSSDDGINTAGGSDATPGGTPAYDAACSAVINGGDITIVSEGDCIDSNGDITVNGGTLNLTCGGNGNTALDCNGTYTNNGGSVTTNDGSESGGGMGGPMGGMPPGGQMGTPPDGGQMGGPPSGGPPDGNRPDMADSSATAT